MRIRKRAWVFALVGPLPQALGYVGGPLALSRRAQRHGWTSGRPGRANLIGLAPLLAGSAAIGAAVASHYTAAPEQMRVTATPEYLATGGIYGLTRNPMYLGGTLIQAGWAILLGSIPAACAGLLYVIGIDRVGIRFEERMLVAKFGATYEDYRCRVPRWLGPRR